MSVIAATRIVVALDPEVSSEIGLDIVRYLQSGATELLGLFVEDARLLAHASSRFAREVVLSGSERPLERPALERQIRAQAEEQRQRFESAAARLGLRHSFHVARGERLAELMREATNAEALVVTLAARPAALRGWSVDALRELAHAPLRTVLFAREGWSTGSRIVTLLPHAEHDAPALQTAIRVARASRSPLTVLLGAAAAAHAAEVERWLVQALQGGGLSPPTLLATGELTAAKLSGAARGARLVVLPALRSTAEETLLDAALTMRVPLLLVREGAES
jgi:hypothetical protein